jgi:hypothetical protein
MISLKRRILCKNKKEFDYVCKKYEILLQPSTIDYFLNKFENNDTVIFIIGLNSLPCSSTDCDNCINNNCKYFDIYYATDIMRKEKLKNILYEN